MTIQEKLNLWISFLEYANKIQNATEQWGEWMKGMQLTKGERHEMERKNKRKKYEPVKEMATRGANNQGKTMRIQQCTSATEKKTLENCSIVTNNETREKKTTKNRPE